MHGAWRTAAHSGLHPLLPFLLGFLPAGLPSLSVLPFCLASVCDDNETTTTTTTTPITTDDAADGDAEDVLALDVASRWRHIRRVTLVTPVCVMREEQLAWLDC